MICSWTQFHKQEQVSLQSSNYGKSLWLFLSEIPLSGACQLRHCLLSHCSLLSLLGAPTLAALCSSCLDKGSACCLHLSPCSWPAEPWAPRCRPSVLSSLLVSLLIRRFPPLCVSCMVLSGVHCAEQRFLCWVLGFNCWNVWGREKVVPLHCHSSDITSFCVYINFVITIHLFIFSIAPTCQLSSSNISLY